MKRWDPDVPDAQMIAEREHEQRMASVVRWERSDVGGGQYSETGYDADGNAVVLACGSTEPTQLSRVQEAQDAMAFESQDTLDADEWA